MTTIVCSDCKLTLGKEDFSKSQLKKKATATRRCLSCAKIVDSNNTSTSTSTSTNTSTSNNNPCYHGCITKKEFHCVEYYKILEDYDGRSGISVIEFFEKHKRLMVAPTFSRFVMAHITDEYLKGKYDAILLRRLMLLLIIRYDKIPTHEGKDCGPESEIMESFHKYWRDIKTERGRINFMAREIPCDCMEEKRIEAKLMEKVAVCFECQEEFAKETMLRCKGCNCVQYCSKECSIKDWPTHKAVCRKYGT